MVDSAGLEFDLAPGRELAETRMTRMKRIATNENARVRTGLEMVAADFADRNDVWPISGELLEAERVHSIVGAFFTVDKFFRLLTFPDDPRF